MIHCNSLASFHTADGPLWRRALSLSLLLGMVLLPAASLTAQEPLHLVPVQADLVLKIDRPGKVVEALYQHEIIQDFMKIEGVGDLFDTTNYRRLLQLKDFFEKKLGVGGMDALDRLTGNGVAFAARVHDTPAYLLVIQSKDEARLRQFVDLAVNLLEQELARQEIKVKLMPRKFGKLDGYQFDKGCAVIAGPNLIVASDPGVLQASIDLIGKKGAGSVIGHPRFSEAKKLLPRQPLVWSWVDMESVRKIENFRIGLASVSMDPNSLFVFGGLVDMIQRSPVLVSSLSLEGQNFVLENRMPVGRKGMDAKAALYLPNDDKGTLPLLQPARTLASISYYLDLNGFWENRSKLLDPMAVQALEQFDADTAKNLGGTKPSTLLKQTGPHQRIVVAQPLKSPYSVKPEFPVPAFALVQEIRDPALAKTMNTLLRAGGLYASFKLGMRMVEEKHGEQSVIAYYFNEKKNFDGDAGYFRLNYSPSFVVVNNQLVISSTAELAHDLVDAILKEGKSMKTLPATTQIALFAKGGAEVLESFKEQLLAQAILNQAQPPAAARKQIESFIGFVDRLGSLRFEVQYGDNDFRHAIRWQYK